MLIVAAIGRSALPFDGDVAALQARAGRIARSLAPLAKAHRLVVTHAIDARDDAGAALPADLRTARDAGLAGHLLARELRNALPTATVASVLAQAVVPCPVEPAADEDGAPSPCRVVELALLRELVERDGIVLCVGCAPVGLDAAAMFVACDRELDHDAAAAALASDLAADILLLLTDVDGVFASWPARGARIERLDAAQDPPAGLDPRSIGAKVRAGCRFARTRGTFAVIGAAQDAPALVAGHAGTCIAAATI
jgi:carbamate kinase